MSRPLRVVYGANGSHGVAHIRGTLPERSSSLVNPGFLSNQTGPAP